MVLAMMLSVMPSYCPGEHVKDLEGAGNVEELETWVEEDAVGECVGWWAGHWRYGVES